MRGILLLKDKKVLVVGLGTLGGGISTIKWLLKQGAHVTITDLRTEKELENSIKELNSFIKTEYKKLYATHRTQQKNVLCFVLGKHRESDFKNNEIIVVNPAVKIKGNQFLEITKKSGKIIINDLIFFLENNSRPIIAVTGTRGKTTTTNWIAHFLSSKYRDTKAGGNSSHEAFLKILSEKEGRKKTPVVLELSSFQLEIAHKTKHAPDIVLITNLYRDHLNRHGTMSSYALAKAQIFKHQKKNQFLVLNKDDKWTNFFLKKNPSSTIFFFSQKPLSKNKNGIYVKQNCVYFKNKNIDKLILSEKKYIEFKNNWGVHNVQNLLGALIISHLFGISWNVLVTQISSLPSIPYREEIIIKKKNLLIVNDTTATSPEGSIAAIERFKKHNTFLITGGTDKNLEYSAWAREVKKYIHPQNLFLLNGSATKKMIRELKKINYFKKIQPQLFENLQTILKTIKNITTQENSSSLIRNQRVILFSPSSASFEKFKNEFDRGEKFNLYSKQLF